MFSFLLSQNVCEKIETYRNVLGETLKSIFLTQGFCNNPFFGRMSKQDRCLCQENVFTGEKENELRHFNQMSVCNLIHLQLH